MARPVRRLADQLAQSAWHGGEPAQRRPARRHQLQSRYPLDAESTPRLITKKGAGKAGAQALQIRLVAIRIMGCVKRLVRLGLGFLVGGCLDGFLTVFGCILKILHCRLALIALGITQRRTLAEA